MSLVLNMVGGGGGGDTYAFVVAAYPAGSTCTCVKGGKTLTAKDTSGTWAFQIPEAGTWTVTSTDGTDTASTTVTISTEGQSESITLSYRLYIIKNGIWQIDDSTVTKTRVTTASQIGYIQEKTTGNVVGGVVLPSLDITQYDSIVLTVETGSVSWYDKQCPALGISSSSPSIGSSVGSVNPHDAFQLMNSAQGPINAGTYTLEISSYSGEKFIWITCSGYGSNLGTVNIVDWYLE